MFWSSGLSMEWGGMCAELCSVMVDIIPVASLLFNFGGFLGRESCCKLG